MIAIKSYRSVCRKVVQRTKSLWGNRKRTISYRDVNSSSCNVPSSWISETLALASHPSLWVRSMFSATRSSCSSYCPQAHPPPCPSRSLVPRLEIEEWESCSWSSNCYCLGSNQLRPTLEACTPSRLRWAEGILAILEKRNLYDVVALLFTRESE